MFLFKNKIIFNFLNFMATKRVGQEILSSNWRRSVAFRKARVFVLVESEGFKNIRIWNKHPGSAFSEFSEAFSFSSISVLLFRDAEIMRQKQEKKKADAAAAAAGK
jgi:hypothetical protein